MNTDCAGLALAQSSAVNDVLRAQAQAVLARLLLVNPQVFFQFVEWPGNQQNLPMLIQQWVTNVCFL